MATSDSDLPPQATITLSQSTTNEDITESGAKIEELNESTEKSPISNSVKAVQPPEVSLMDLDESQSELLSRIQGMKQNVLSWRSMMDTRLKSYQDELSGLKKQLETELENLSLDFKELKTTLQKQQEDVTNSLKSLGLQDVSKNSESKIETKDDSLVKEQILSPSSKNETKTTEESSPK